MNWEQKFAGKILSRGYDYWRHGNVTDLSRVDDSTYLAEVQGTETYGVTVKKGLGNKLILTCSCPYAEESNCKHMAAALYEIEDSDPEFLQLESRQSSITIPENLQNAKAVDFPYPPQDSFFTLDPVFAIYKMRDTDYAKACALIQNGKIKLTHCRCNYVSDDSAFMEAVARSVNEDGSTTDTIVSFSRAKLLEFNCSGTTCIDSDYKRYYYNSGKSSGYLCYHKIATLILIAEYITNENPGDYSDSKGIRLLNTILNNQSSNVRKISLGTNMSQLSLSDLPVDITAQLDYRQFTGYVLSFEIKRTKSYILRDPVELYDVYTAKGKMSFGKSLEVDFATAKLTPRAEAILDFVGKAYQGGMEFGRESIISERVSDDFYDSFQNLDITCSNGKIIEFTTGKPAFNSKVTPLIVRGKTEGVAVEFFPPYFLEGTRYNYFLNILTNEFVRVERNNMGPLSDVLLSSRSYKYTCSIGKNHLNDFTARILPALKTYGKVDISECPDLSTWEIPEPEFSFNLDYTNQIITCSAFVRYGENTFDMSQEIILSKRERDIFRENAVSEQLDELFESKENGIWQAATSDSVYLFLSQGLPILMNMGIVNASSSFNSLRIRHSTKAKAQVSVEGNLLELDIQTEDMSVEELLDLIESYKQHKVYHRLKDGSFVDIDNKEIADLAEFLACLDIGNKELIKGKIKIPAYRALYIDRLMKERDTLKIDRDNSFKKIIRDFDTFKDSEKVVPASLSDVLRNYQADGFRWLTTLGNYGFGGILADEMGLGKTVQILSYLLSNKKEKSPSLVVCPASLVYNWAAEAKRFTPELSTLVISGKQKEREDLIATCENYDLVITSYDLLKRDILCYKEKSFDVEVIDEAQFIKNSGTEASKAVKLINSNHRFALTGTPIENRLSELWSIFDFLMPGFLFGQENFKRDFEVPIMKDQSTVAMQRLVRMTSPFILRRLKTDVLKDLPEKLEEARYARLSDNQRKLYDAQLTKIKFNINNTKEADFNKSKIQILAEITRLRQICCDPSLAFENYSETSAKRALCSDLIQSAIDGGHRILVFSQFTSMLALLEKDLKDLNIPYFELEGSTDKLKRLELVERFNAGEVPVFLISLKAGGTGLNLTGADIVIHYDPWWNVAVEDQATDRAHRIGQTKVVTVYRLIAQNTIEEKIVELQEKKRNLAEDILSGSNTSLGSLTKEELLEILS